MGHFITGPVLRDSSDGLQFCYDSGFWTYGLLDNLTYAVSIYLYLGISLLTFQSPPKMMVSFAPSDSLKE